MDKLQVFQNGLFEAVRAMLINDEPWFVAGDVAKALDYDNTSEAIRYHVDDEDIMKSRELSQTNSKLLMINESGVYALIFGSKQERAKQFKRWVTHEVLPALRRTGQYGTVTNRVELSGEQAIELAKVLSQVATPNLPYVLSALKMAGFNIDQNYPALTDGSTEKATENIMQVKVRSRKYPWDMELVRMINQFADDKMGMQELADRAFVPINTLYQLKKGYSNTSPEFAARIKETIREMYAEKNDLIVIAAGDNNKKV